jgi:hypothetical protein
MDYKWQNIIASDETVQKDFTVSRRFRQALLIGSVILAIFLSFQNIYGGIIILLLGLLYWRYMSTAKHYAFTNKRVILVESFITKNITSIDYNQITDIEINKNAKYRRHPCARSQFAIYRESTIGQTIPRSNPRYKDGLVNNSYC